MTLYPVPCMTLYPVCDVVNAKSPGERDGVVPDSHEAVTREQHAVELSIAPVQQVPAALPAVLQGGCLLHARNVCDVHAGHCMCGEAERAGVHCMLQQQVCRERKKKSTQKTCLFDPIVVP